MGNTNTNQHHSSALSSSTARGPANAQDSNSKEIRITTDKPDGFYFTGERLTGTVEVPISYLQQQWNAKSTRKFTELLRQHSLEHNLHVELVGEATYSAEVDVAADSDGHATHQVNLCRQGCFVTINYDDEQEQSLDSIHSTETSDIQVVNSSSLPSTIKGIFQLQIPTDLPATLNNNRPPSVTYTLELNLSSSRYRYQIPIALSSKGYVPHLTTDIELTSRASNPHDIQLQGSVPRRFYRPGEQIPIRVNYHNAHQRPIRSITLRLLQFYRIHNDQYCAQLDGKEWTFDVTSNASQREWLGEGFLQLPYQPLPASFSNQSVGTTQQIACELDYRIFIELNEKKGDDIQLTLPSIHVTYHK